MPPMFLTLHLVLLNVKVVQTLRNHEVLPLISNEFDETVPSSTMASHLELGETRISDVDHVDDVDLDVDADELVITEELLAKHKEAQELQAHDICFNGTLHLSRNFKVSGEGLYIKCPVNITADRVTIFLEHSLSFQDTVHFHGELSVVAVRWPLDGPCLNLRGDGVVGPDTVLRFAGCENGWRNGGAMYVGGKLDVRGDMEQSVPEPEGTEEHLAEAQELPRCFNGTLHLSGDFKVTAKRFFFEEPCNITADRVTLFLEHSLSFQDTVHFHGKLLVVAVRSLDGPCVNLLGDGVVGPDTVLRFAGCENGGGWGSEHGGAMYVGGNLDVHGGVHIRDSRAYKNGGAIFVNNSFTQSGGTLTIVNSSAYNLGGAIYASSFTQSGGNLTIADASAKSDGGGIYVQRSFTNSGGKIEVSGSLARDGGGIFVYDNFIHLGGNLEISNSSALEYGGGIYVQQSFTNSGGKVAILGSSAKRNGGGIYVQRSFTNSGGKVAILGSSAKQNGGGIFVYNNFNQSGGSLSISESSAEYGGGIYVRNNFTQCGAIILVVNSFAQNGGGLYVHSGNAVFANAMASFRQCHAQLKGGGIMTPGNVSITNASLMFELATAGEHGAAFLVSHLEQTGGTMKVYKSSASGGVISVAAWFIDGGNFHIEDCKANSFLMEAREGARLHATQFSAASCSAAGMLISNGEVTMSNGKFDQTSSPQLRANVVKVTRLTVTGTAWISWASASTVQDMDCDDAFGGYKRSDGIGCTKCDVGSVFLKNSTKSTITNSSDSSAVQHCVPCPDGARLCDGTAVEMLPGMMVERQNISRGFHCPNPLACKGGNVSSKASTAMCTEGYEDVGCAKCTNDHARSNSNVFICIRCAQDMWWRIKDALLFFTSDAVIFIISAAGVVSAGRQNKSSTVYLNQLMSFAAVTAPALLAVKNTATFVWFKQHFESLRPAFTFVFTPVQVGDAGGGATIVSADCILRYMGLEPSLPLSHALSSLVYMVLMLCLAVKSGMSIALVVGINCFLPNFCAAFGKYLICYMMDRLSAPHCLAGENWLDAPSEKTLAVAAIGLCFFVGPGSWINMTRDKCRSDKPEVLFLTRSYRKGFETWEAERLVRRMLLKIIGATIPITTHPSTQMAFLSFVLVASLFLHAKQAPYMKEEWNQMEQGLLVTALIIVILTTLCLANELHWARSDATQVVLILAIAGIVGIAGFVQSFLLIRELILERLPEPVNTPEPMEPSEPPEQDGEVSKG